MQTFLVTGSSGFVGTGAVGRLLRCGHRVVGLDRRSSPLIDARYIHVQAEITSVKASQLPECDGVIHAAGRPGTGGWGQDFPHYARDNIEATAALLELVKAWRSRFVLVSSGSVYGSVVASPLTEELQPRPFSPYAVTKHAAEQITLAYAANFGLDVVIARLFYVVGPGQRSDVIVFRLLRAAAGGPRVEVYGSAAEAVRDFVDVRDAAEAISLLATAKELSYPLYNVATGTLTALSQVRDFAASLSSGHADLWAVGDERPGYLGGAPGSTARLRDDLGWSSRYTVWEALQTEYEWLRGSTDELP